MEHQKIVGKPICNVFKFLPRASSVIFQNSPLSSPAKDKKPSAKPHKSNLGIGSSAPMVSIDRSDSRRKTKNDSKFALVYEPISPRVSWMGQVKCKHHQKLTSTANLTNKFPRTTSYNPVRSYKTEEAQVKIIKCKKISAILRLLSGGSRRKSDATNKASETMVTLPKAPCLSTMKRFSSGRDAFMSFDWRTQVAPLDSAPRDDETDCEEVRIPSSAPVKARNEGICENFIVIGVVKLEPRKEINLWKRRTMAQPQPLQVHAAK